MVKMNKTWFFEKINKIDKPLARLIKHKRENSQINKIRNEKEQLTTDNAEIQRIRTSLSLFTFMHWRRKWQPTPVFLPGESQGQGSLVGCSLWGHTESDMTEATQQQQQQHDTIINNLHGNKMDNLEIRDIFLEKFNLQILNQEEIEIMNNSIMSTTIKAVIKNLPQNQKPRTRWLHR